jgi:serine/threonine protein kinase
MAFVQIPLNTLELSMLKSLLPMTLLWSRRGRKPSTLESRIPGYVLQEELGRGGTAVVYRAMHKGQPCALKLMKVGTDVDASARMRREIKLMRRLSHPGIVGLRDSGEVNGQVYMVMEKVEGETLRNHLMRRRLNRGQALRYAEALLDALSYAHSQDIMHRDLKPENLMVQCDGRLRLLDFGFSRNVHQNTFQTMDSAVAGTPAYMAPERLMCVNTPASDQYSAGLIIYEMLVGEPAVPAGLDVPTVITKQLQETPPSPGSLDTSLPVWVDFFVMKLLAKRPEERFASAQEALEYLRGYSEYFTPQP